MKYYLILVISATILLNSCSEENFDNTTTFYIDTEIDTVHVNSGELKFDYNGEKALYNSIGYLCHQVDTMQNIDTKDYIITNAEYKEEENLFVFLEDGHLISYLSDEDKLQISIYVESENRLIRNILTEPYNITINESAEVLQGTWSALFEANTGGSLENWEPVGYVEGSFYVPVVLRCE